MAEILSDLLTKIANRQKPPVSVTGMGGVFVKQAKVAVLATHADGDVYRLFSVPSSAIPINMSVGCSAITDGTDWDLGIYNHGAGGEVLDRDVLLDGITMAVTSTRFYIGAFLIANDGKPFWELAGLDKDPGGDLDICLTANTVGTVDGTVVVNIFYNANN